MNFIASLVKDITANGNSTLNNLTEFDGKLFFTVDGGTNGKQLYVSDGTANNTILLADLKEVTTTPGTPPAPLTDPIAFAKINNSTFFTAKDSANKLQLYVSNGTANGTQAIEIKDSSDANNTGSDPANLITFNNKLFFSVKDAGGKFDLWSTDGTAAGTKAIENNVDSTIALKNFKEFNGSLLFTADNKLWSSDGTGVGAGTKEIDNAADLDLATLTAGTSVFTEFNGKLVFSVKEAANKYDLWITDGKTITKKLDGIDSKTHIEHFTEINGKLFFSAKGADDKYDLWSTDGANATAVVNGATNSNDPIKDLTKFNNTSSFFSVKGADNKYDLWVTDGSEGGTKVFKDINSDTAIENLTLVNGKLFFEANDGTQEELWISDGTDAGTKVVKNIDSTSGIDNFTVANDKVFFVATDGTNGKELWVSNGTEAGTAKLTSLENATPGIESITTIGNTIFFIAKNAKNEKELWSSDGTTAGTKIVADINKDADDKVGNLISFNGNLFFTAQDSTSGEELRTLKANTDPVAKADAFKTNASTVLQGNVLADNGNGKDEDPDGGSLTITKVNGNDLTGQIILASGTLLKLNADGSFDYNPNGKFDNLTTGQTQTDTFTYTVDDGNGGTATATVTITVDANGSTTTTQTPNNGQSTSNNTTNNGQSTSNNTTNNGQNSTITGLQSTITRLQNTNNGLQNTIESLQNNNNGLQNNITGLQNNITELQSIIRNLQGTDSTRLRGGRGNDSLRGTDGDDLLDGGRGKDRLFGGNGRDTFRFGRSILSANEKPDVILDFEVGVDKIDLTKFSKTRRFRSNNFFDDFVRIKRGSGNKTRVQIDIDGVGDGQKYKTLVNLKDVNFNTVDADSFTV